MASISVSNVSKLFTIDRKTHGSGALAQSKHVVLNNISFEVSEGECVGIIGKNGSGKSTLLRLLAGILEPDSGTIKVEGGVLPLLELHAGMTEELTGRENIAVKGVIMGIGKDELDEMVPRIITDAGLGDFIDVKFNRYSQGMKLRLAFSIAMQVPHDIILIDEILAVGDEEFQKKSAAKLDELRMQGKTMIIVSHDLDGLASRCERLILLDEGTILFDGAPEEAISTYLRVVSKRHICQMKETILGVLKDISVSGQDAGQPENEHLWGVHLRRLLGKKRKIPLRGKKDLLLEDLRHLIKDFQCLVMARQQHLRREYGKLQGELQERRQHDENPRILELLAEKISQTEQEIRQMMAEEHFLLEVKVKIGGDAARVREEHQAFAARIKGFVTECPSAEDRLALTKTYLKVLSHELATPFSAQSLLAVLGDYSNACFNVFRLETESQERSLVFNRLLEVIKEQLRELKSDEAWILERLFEITKAPFDSAYILPEEMGFTLRYAEIILNSSSKLGHTQTRQRLVEELRKILKRSIGVVEEELASADLKVEGTMPDELLTRKIGKLKENLRRFVDAISALRSGEQERREGAGQAAKSDSGGAEITSLTFLSEGGEGMRGSNTVRSGEPFWASVRYRLNSSTLEALKISLTIHHETGLRLITPNTIITERTRLLVGVENEAVFSLQSQSLPFQPGRYPVTVSLQEPRSQQVYDHWDMTSEFVVLGVDPLKSPRELSPDQRETIPQTESGTPAFKSR